VNVLKRLRDLQTSSPLKVRYVYHAYVQNMNLAEMELHHRFSDQREIGEWFSFTKEDVQSCILLMRLVQNVDPFPSVLTDEEEQWVGSHDSEELAVIDSARQQQGIKLILQCRARGIISKGRIIHKIWGVQRGSSRAYRMAEAEYESLIPLIEEKNEPDQNGESERAERALQLKAKGWGKAKIILEIWGVTKGGSPKYKAAEAEYKRLMQEEGGF